LAFKKEGIALIMIFIGAIITVTFIQSIANQTTLSTNTYSVRNATTTLCSTANCTTDVVGRELVGTGFIQNRTGIAVVRSVVLQNGIGSNGLLTVQYFLNDTAITQGYGGAVVNGTYTYNPDGYVSSTGGRSITNLIVIISALAILLWILVMLIRDGPLMDWIKGRL
jgi:hypothetical protein